MTLVQTLSRDTANSRYALQVGDELIATAEYAEGDDAISITRVFTRPTHRGQGLAAVITEYAVDDIVERGKKVVPVCWYAAKWFEERPERAGALA